MARRGERHLRDWGLQLFVGVTYLLFLALSTPWGFIPYPFRYVWPALFAVAAIRAWRDLRRPRAADAEPLKPRRSVLFSLALVVYFGVAVVNGLRGYRYTGQALNLEFPLREGAYLVAHGGAHPSINYHNVHPQQRYALDIAALNGLGVRSWGVGTRHLDRYAIYGRTLYSPCDAIVRSVVSDLPDQIPPASDGEHAAGNHVELAAEGARIYLAHMRPGSIRVKAGDRVKRGDPLGAVGNSGNTTEPHLHLHAVRGGHALYVGEGIPITFRGRFLVRNDLVVAR
jgi:murein DD-endopeptidase MepM/ murein hydrolase activator NlpD